MSELSKIIDFSHGRDAQCLPVIVGYSWWGNSLAKLPCFGSMGVFDDAATRGGVIHCQNHAVW